MRTATGAALLTVISASVLAGGCGFAHQNVDDPNYVSAGEATKEYRKEAQKWNLARGWTWPETPYADRESDGAPKVYEKGSGKIDASFYWFCSWGRTFMDARAMEERNAAARQALRIRETPFYTDGLASRDRPAFDKNVVEPAIAGNFSGVTDVVEQNCKDLPS